MLHLSSRVSGNFDRLWCGYGMKGMEGDLGTTSNLAFLNGGCDQGLLD